MIVVVGLSHQRTPIEIRERVAIDAESCGHLLASLKAMPQLREVACISTCNRTELVAVGRGHDEGELQSVARALVSVLERIAARNGAGDISRYLNVQMGPGAIQHLFRVASALDSLVIGEPQILGQVKSAFEAARVSGTLGPFLERVMSRALHVAKRVRTETSIGAGQVSISSVAIDLARQIFGDLTGRTVVLLGAGEMAEAAAKLLVRVGAKLVVVNRSVERAEALAREMGGVPRSFTELPACLVEADVVVASTAARGFVVTNEMVRTAMRSRRGRSLFFIDIAVPRDIEPSVHQLDNVYLYDIDDLSHIVAQSMQGRQKEAERAEAIVVREAQTFELWAERLNVTPTIVALRAKVRGALGAELERSLSGRLKHLGPAEREALGVMLDAAVNRLLHGPVTRIKELVTDPRGEELVQAAHLLFDLPQLAEGQAPSEAPSNLPDAAAEGGGSPRR